jgi:fructokinase
VNTATGPVPEWAIGIDLGGSKIAGALLARDGSGAPVAEHRLATPREDYGATLAAIAALVQALDEEAAALGGTTTGAVAGPRPPTSVGVGIPGSLAPDTGLVQNANSTWLNGRPLDRDLAERLGRPVRVANDADCFALSEARDGAGAGKRTVLGLILGTGCGAGVVVDGRLLGGPRGTGGEWGHNPLPSPEPVELPGPRCWCGRDGCMETWVSGPALAADHARLTGTALTAEAIVAAAAAGDGAAEATLARHLDRLARGLAVVVNILDPDVVVIGGGLSHLQHLYDALPRAMAPRLFAADTRVDIRPPVWGDAGGVRGAAWLWEGVRRA